MGSRRGELFLVIVRPQAADDIDEYIRQDSPQNAEAVVERLFATMDTLARFPRRGRPAHEAEECGVDLRQVVSDSFRVLYMGAGARCMC